MKFALITFGNEESYGLLFVGGELLEHEQEIRYFDGEDDDVVQHVTEWNPDFMMFSPMTTFYSAALWISRLIKRHRPGIVSVFGGHHAMSVPEIIESDGVDIVVVGPVRGSIEAILGGSVGVIKTRLTEPSDLPKPARRQYYEDIPRMGERYRKFVLSVLGCPWNCSYCSSSRGHMVSMFGACDYKRYYLEHRPLGDVLDELKEIVSYDTTEIEWVDDDFFAGDEKWLLELAGEWRSVVNRRMYVSATSHSVLKASDKLLDRFSRIVNVVGMGVQAGRPDSLKLFNRQWDNEAKMKAAYDRLVSFGYSVNLQCIVGLPVVDPVEDAIDTIKCMQRIGAGSICSCYPLQVYPGTELEKYCKNSGIDLNDTCSGDTNSGVTGIRFDYRTAKILRNICKLATLFVKYNIDDRWLRALIGIDFDDVTSRNLSLARYRDCVVDRLKKCGELTFDSIIAGTKLRY
jgi:radical SAM superfamily enzyme YgiQ (UPF0313 family)